jgi:hypothetical protein
MQEEVKHYKVKSLSTQLRPNSVYYVKATSQSTVKTYITDQNGFPFPLVDLTGGGNVGVIQSVTGTGVTGTFSNPIINISTFKSSDLGNLIELSTNDGKLFVKPITSPDGSISIANTLSALEIQISPALQTQIQNALQPGDNISELNNDAGYITLANLPFSAVSATAWTPNHIAATGNPYLVGTIVYYLGHIFQANFTNDSIIPAIGGNLYWTDLGVGYLIDQEQTDWLAVSGSAFIRNKPTNVSSFTNDAGYITSFTETDPVFSAWLSSNPLSGYATETWVGNNFYPLSSNPSGYLTQQSVLEFSDLASFPIVGASNTIYIALDTDIAYYWDGTAYVVVTTSTSGISGFGTVNTLPKFTPTGSQLGNSRFTDNGITGRYGATAQYVSFLPGGNTYLSLVRAQAQMNFTLGNPQISQEGVIDSINTYGSAFISRGYTAFRVGALGTIEPLRLLSTGQIQLPVVPTTGTTSDFLLMRDTSGNVRQIAYPTIPAGGLPPGGTAGQILTKVDATDYNATWQENYADWTSVVKHIVKNDGTGLITKGTPVYSTGANGTNILVGKASNTSEATSSKTMGLMQSDITTTGGTQTGFVITEGLLGGLNTAGQTAGDPVWLGVNGALIYGLTNKPYAPAHLVFIGIVTKVSAGNGEIFVKIQNGFELDELHNVDLKTTVPINGHLLGFDGTLWVNKTIASWLGYTPANDSTFLYDKFMTNQFAYFLPMDGISLYDTLRVGGSLTSTGTASSLSENPMGVLYTTAAAVGSVAGLYGSAFGGSGYLGSNFQFEIIRKFRISTNNGAQRLFIGMSSLYNTTAPTNVEPTTLLNSIGVAKLQGSPNLHFVWNDATGTASSLDLGSGFLGTDTACTYKLRIYKNFNVPVIFIELTKIVNSTGVVTSVTNALTSDYNTGVSYYPVLWIGNNTAVSGACSIKDYGCIQNKRNIIAS